jgi:hypothetical protein
VDPALSSSSLVVQVVELAAGGLVAVAAYVAWARVFKLPELDEAMDLARTLIGRKNRPGVAEDEA